MNKLLTAIFAAALINCTFSAVADDTSTDTSKAGSDQMMKKDDTGMHSGTHKMGRMGMRSMNLKAMDSNSDGTVSKDEFMSYYEKKYEGMPKNKDGTVDVKGMKSKSSGSMGMSPDQNSSGQSGSDRSGSGQMGKDQTTTTNPHGY